MARGDRKRDVDARGSVHEHSSAAPPARESAPFGRHAERRASSELTSGVRYKPVRSALDCMRHDARSAAHALNGFLDLLQLNALGALSDEQRRAIKHMAAAAERMSEITESALELAEAQRPLRPSEQSRTCLVHVAQHVLYGVSRALPATNITFAAEEALSELHVEVHHDALSKLLTILMDVVRSSAPQQIDVRISRTDLHASLVVAARSEQPSAQHTVAAQAAASDLDAMAEAWSNREYVRLKRLESLLSRHKGRLLVAPDLTRVRMMLPLSRH